MRRIAFLLLVLLPLAGRTAYSLPAGKFELGGYLQFWYLYEEAPNGKIQDVTGDAGAQVASGLSVNKARLQGSADWDTLGADVQLRLEGGSVGLLDAYFWWQIAGKALELDVGQMKIPSAWEVAVSDNALDFPQRSRFATEVTDWSLCRSSFSTSPLYYVQTAQRDMGVGLKGELLGLSYFLMVGNGLGANDYVGAVESKQFALGNYLGAYMYAARLSYDLLTEIRELVPGFPASLEIGGHYLRNIHPNFIAPDNTVQDLNRTSWSADVRLRLFDRIRLTAMYGEGTVDDDFDHDGSTDYSYSGWEARIVVVILPDFLEVGGRYDVYSWNRAVTSGWTTASALTAGVTCAVPPHLRIQADYRWKLQSGDLAQNFDTNVVMLVLGVAF